MHAPATEEALAALVREGTPLQAVGGGTKRAWGPASSGAPVSTLGLAGIVAYEPGDLVVTARAGTRLDALQAELARHGQWLPLDPPCAGATIGGVLATNSSGPRRLAYGTARDLLLGLRVVGPDGVVTRSGGRVVKNVTGIDLHKLHVGAFGSLGIITEASFKVRPRPERSVAFVYDRASVADGLSFLLGVAASALRPAALELTFPPAVAIVGVEGSEAVVERHRRELPPADRTVEGPAIWEALRAFPEKFAGKVCVRLGARPHDLPALLPDADALQVHAGTGVAHLYVEPAADLPARIAAWSARAGYAVAQSAPADAPGRDRLPWGGPPSPLMRAIKQSRDPRGLLNPGRIAL
jgi:glycolate oxidase FAD binding subunit